MNEHEVLLKESILTGQSFSSKEEATIMAGELLLENGYIEKEYIDSMLEKLDTQSFATYIGNGVAIPHGMADGSKFVRHTGISVIQVPEGIPWNEEVAYVIVGIGVNLIKCTYIINYPTTHLRELINKDITKKKFELKLKKIFENNLKRLIKKRV